MANLAYPMLYITRKEKGDTQKEVATKLGISLNECQILSEMYDMPIDELFSSKIKANS